MSEAKFQPDPSAHALYGVFDRYDIVIEADLAETGENVVRYCMSENLTAHQD